MKRILPETPFGKFQTRDRITTTSPSVLVKRRVLESLPCTPETVYESTPRKPKFEIEIDDNEE